MREPARAAGEGAVRATPRPTVSARIGPNAIIQTAAAVAEFAGADEAAALLASTSWSLQRLPRHMVDEQEVSALMRAVADRFPGASGHRIARDAGERTADYLLRVRIPRGAQWLLARLPRRLSLRLLLGAIRRHAWTFAGSARFVVSGRDGAGGSDATFSLIGCPVCRGRHATDPACTYYAATVERLVQAIVQPTASVREERCEALGHDACRFAIHLAPARPPGEQGGRRSGDAATLQALTDNVSQSRGSSISMNSASGEPGSKTGL